MRNVSYSEEPRRDHEAPRRRLLDAAFHSIQRYGFAGASEALICDYAGLSRGGLHYHFKRGKTDLLIALADELYRRSYQRTVDNLAKGSKQALLDALDETIATEAGGFADDQRVLVELWLGARSSEKMANTLGTAIEEIRQRYWADLRALSGADWDPVIARYGYLFRTFLRGVAVERSAGEGSAEEHLAMLRLLRGWIGRELDNSGYP